MSEHDEQVLFFDHVRLKRKSDWRYRLVFSVPNAGKRKVRSGNWMVAEGLTKGVLDVLCLHPDKDNKYLGLAIEFKVKPNKLTVHQKEWGDLLIKAGYLPTIAWSGQEGIQIVDTFLGPLRTEL